jgi:lysophospholipase L1-like esterase
MRARFRTSLWLSIGLLVSVLAHSAAAQATATQQAARASDPLRFQKEMAEFDAEDKASMPPPGAIVITGSSSIRRWHPTIKQDLAPLTVVPRGFGGSTMEDALYWIDRLTVPYKPRAVVIYEGDNDTGAGVPAERIVQQFESIVARIHKALPETRIYVMSVKPSVLRWKVWPEAVKTNQMLKALTAKDKLITYIDVGTPFLQPSGQVMTDIFVPDNLHLNEKGYKIWTEAVRAVLIPAEGKYERSTSN